MERTKENALSNFIDMIRNSWTWARMTENEQNRLLESLCNSRTKDALKGNFDQRWKVLNALYGVYLDGIGYDGMNWREPKQIDPREQARKTRNEYIRTLCNPQPFVNHSHY